MSDANEVNPAEAPGYKTRGRSFRYYASEGVTDALGRALWNLLCAEEIVPVIVCENGEDEDWNLVRSLDAQGKVDTIRRLRKTLKKEGAPEAVTASLEIAADALEHAKREYRNRIAHGIPTVAYRGKDGVDVAGLAHVDQNGRTSSVAHGVDEMLDVANAAEHAIDPLFDAVAAVKSWREEHARPEGSRSSIPPFKPGSTDGWGGSV